MDYIEQPKQTDRCVFCDAIAATDGPENLIIFRGSQAFVILNRFPYTSGHLMVVPFEHLASLQDLNGQTRAEIMELTAAATAALSAAYRPQGFNVGLNIGEAAGAGIEDHIHVHIVPRWIGDTNFMSTLGETRVLPESLEETYRRILTAWRGPGP